jgi:hypothetical protein
LMLAPGLLNGPSMKQTRLSWSGEGQNHLIT